MRHKTGPAFLNALAIQRRRIQQGFQHHSDGRGGQDGMAEPGNALADVTELAVLLEGPHRRLNDG